MRGSISDKRKGMLIVDIFTKFGISTELQGITHGSTYTLFELSIDSGTRIAPVWGLADNLAMALSVDSVRIVAPIPGKSAVGIEVPNKKIEEVSFDSLKASLDAAGGLNLPVILGMDVRREPVVIDLTKCPHLLVAGNPETGKTMFLNSLICSILRTRTADEASIAIIDTKGIEYQIYNGNPHMMRPVITKTGAALDFLAELAEEIDRRIALFNEAGARKIEEYNQHGTKLPYIVVLVDEFSYLMMEDVKRLERLIKRITAVARFCGIHLVFSTNRCSADVITGVIKSYFPSQIAFAVSSGINSRIIMDQTGAEKLLGAGDMLFSLGGSRNLLRVQCPYIDDLDISR